MGVSALSFMFLTTEASSLPHCFGRCVVIPHPLHITRYPLVRFMMGITKYALVVDLIFPSRKVVSLPQWGQTSLAAAPSKSVLKSWLHRKKGTGRW